MTDSLLNSTRSRIQSASEAQADWKDLPLNKKLEIVKAFRMRLVAHAERLHELHPIPSRTLTQTITSEIIPLAAACRWLEKSAAKTLRARRTGWWGRPIWLQGVTGSVEREPHGVVLILGTWNYPIFLTGVQILQALVAGNAVVVKPGRDSFELTRLMLSLLGPVAGSRPHGVQDESDLATQWPSEGLYQGLVELLDEDPEQGADAIKASVDYIVLTGSAATGRTVLQSAAEQLTPAAVELSGSDAMFVMPNADRKRVIDAIRFGLRFNASATCIAPRRILLSHFGSHGETAPMAIEQDHLVASIDTRFVEESLLPALQVVNTPTPDAVWHGVDDLLNDAAAEGAIIHDHRGEQGWIVVDGAKPSMRLTQADVFAPIVSVMHCYSISEMLAADQACPYALAASVFGNEHEVAAVLPHIKAGTVTINDLIAPTADPRVPFGGFGQSGFGVTRGPEGLLAMTRPRVVLTNSSRWLPHLDDEREGDAEMLGGAAELLYGESKWAGLRKMFSGGRRRSKH